MTAQTPWSYTVDELPPLISLDDFRTIAPNLSATDAQITQVLGSVSQAIRDICGWHVGPSLACTFTGEGEGRLLMLPAMGVTAVSSLVVGGVEIDPADFEWTAAGMVRLKGACFPDEWRSVECTYTAGFSTGSLAQIAAQIASNSIAASPGVREEHAGSVGITYNETGAGITGGVSILPRDLALLAPYRLARAW